MRGSVLKWLLTGVSIALGLLVLVVLSLAQVRVTGPDGSRTGAFIDTASTVEIPWLSVRGTGTQAPTFSVRPNADTDEVSVSLAKANGTPWFSLTGTPSVNTAELGNSGAPILTLSGADNNVKFWGYVIGGTVNAGAPPAGDCDADAERTRTAIDTTNFRLYICMGAARGWDYVALTN